MLFSCSREIIFYLNKEYEDQLSSVDIVAKEDLDLVNHLSGKLGKFIKVSFKNDQDMREVKTSLLPIIEKNKQEKETQDAYEGWYNQNEYAVNNQ